MVSCVRYFLDPDCGVASDANAFVRRELLFSQFGCDLLGDVG